MPATTWWCCGAGARAPTSPLTPDVVAVQVHDLVPRGHEVAHEPLPRVAARVDLGDGPQLGVRPEHEVDAARRPPELAGGAVAALEGLPGDPSPFRAHVEQVHEEVVGQHP